MKRIAILVGLLGSLSLAGCSTLSDGLDAINPFSSGGPKLTPLADITAKVDVKTLWSTSVGKGGDYAFRPAVVGGNVYVAARDGALFKLNDGKTVWKSNAGQPLSSGVGADANLLVVGTAKGEVLAFSAESGKPLWQAKVSSEVLATPVVGSEGVAVRTGDNRVHFLDLADGSRKWVYQRMTPALALRSVASPVISDRYVFVGYPGGKLVALGLNNGAAVWEGNVALPKGATELDRVSDVVTPPAIDGSQVCAVAFQGRVACFDLGQGGALVWSREMSSAVGLTLDGRYLFVTDDKGAVHALDRLSGSSMWKQDKLLNRRVTGPIVMRGLVAVGDAQGIVHFMSREDGSFSARIKTDGTPIVLPLQAVGSSFLVQTTGGYVGMIEPQ